MRVSGAHGCDRPRHCELISRLQRTRKLRQPLRNRPHRPPQKQQVDIGLGRERAESATLRGPDLAVIEGVLWEVGEVRLGRRPALVPLWFARRLSDAAVLRHVADAARETAQSAACSSPARGTPARPRSRSLVPRWWRCATCWAHGTTSPSTRYRRNARRLQRHAGSGAKLSQPKPIITAMAKARTQTSYHVDNNEKTSVLGIVSTALEEPVNVPQVSEHNGSADWA